MSAAQVGKTTSIFMLLTWAIYEAPGTAMWVMPDAIMASDMIRNRFLPFLEHILPPENKTTPITSFDKVHLLLNLGTMKLYIRGANSKAKLQSTPVKWLILDEVRNYRPGALELALKRVRSFPQSKTVIISTPSEPNDSLSKLWLDGTRTIIIWTCPYCGHKQPFRFFSEQESFAYGRPNGKGGFKWIDDENTHKGNKWDYTELAKTIYYECENCQAKLTEADRQKIINSYEIIDLNPNHVPGQVSFHTWAAYVPWVKWSDIVIEYINAIESAKGGNVEPIKSFIQETLGEPYVLFGEKPNIELIKKHIGDYSKGEKLEINSVRFLTADIQKEAMIIKYVYRQWFNDGTSRLIDWGVLPSLDALRYYQIEHQIKDKCVWIDTGYKAIECYQQCLRYGWIATKGDSVEHYQFQDPQTHRFVYMPWRMREIDPYLGTSQAGKTRIPLIRFSTYAYKDRLYIFILKNRFKEWIIPKDINEDYLNELSSDEIVFESGKRKWIERGTNDFGDCEILQLVAADVSGLTKTQIDVQEILASEHQKH